MSIVDDKNLRSSGDTNEVSPFLKDSKLQRFNGGGLNSDSGPGLILERVRVPVAHFFP
jgi:hypothetical protein